MFLSEQHPQLVKMGAENPELQYLRQRGIVHVLQLTNTIFRHDLTQNRFAIARRQR